MILKAKVSLRAKRGNLIKMESVFLFCLHFTLRDCHASLAMTPKKNIRIIERVPLSLFLFEFPDPDVAVQDRIAMVLE